MQPYPSIPGVPTIPGVPQVPGAPQYAAPPAPAYAPPAPNQGYPGPAPAAPVYAPPAAPVAPVQYAAPPAPAVHVQQAAPVPQSYASPSQYAPQPQQAAPQFQQMGVGDIGAQIAGATLGVERQPRLDVIGDYILLIDKTGPGTETQGLFAEFTIHWSSPQAATERPAGSKAGWFQPTAFGNAKQKAARFASVKEFVLRGLGYSKDNDRKAAGIDDQQFGALIGACFAEPGPLAGRYIKCSVVAQSDGGVNPKTGRPYVDLIWSPAA